MSDRSPVAFNLVSLYTHHRIICLIEVYLVSHVHPKRAPVLTGVGNLLKSSNVAVKGIRITTPGRRVRVLPEGVEAPASRERADGASIARDDERALAAKGGAVARALRPPAGRGVDERVDARGGVVRVDKVVDPADHGAL